MYCSESYAWLITLPLDLLSSSINDHHQMDYYQDFRHSFSICEHSGEAMSVKCVFTSLFLLDSLQSRFVRLVPRRLASWLGRTAPPKTDNASLIRNVVCQ